MQHSSSTRNGGIRSGRTTTVALAAFLTLAAIAQGCADRTTPFEPGTPGPSAAVTRRVASIVVTPSSASVSVGDTVRLVAEALDRNGRTVRNADVSWTSSNPEVAIVDGSGLVTGIADGSATVTASSNGASDAATVTVTTTSEPPPPPPPTTTAVLVGAGDIARCSSSNDEATAALIDGIAGTVFTTGDNVYDDGTAAEFEDCYDPSWGRHKARTRPSAGNHEYHTSGAAGYFGYFGAAAGDPDEGYYSYDLGAWHVVVLNSNISMSSGSAQVQWLTADLAENSATCTVAYWHHPRFSSGDHGNYSSTQPLWEALYAAGADVVLNGHDHSYERFAPQTPTGSADPEGGIREFVVGTGGAGLYSFGSTQPNSEFRYNSRHGVLKLDLQEAGYSWSFITTDGVVRDTGSDSCH